MRTCILCGGALALLGALGRLTWYRCTACGMDQCKEERTRPK